MRNQTKRKNNVRRSVQRTSWMQQKQKRKQAETTEDMTKKVG